MLAFFHILHSFMYKMSLYFSCWNEFFSWWYILFIIVNLLMDEKKISYITLIKIWAVDMAFLFLSSIPQHTAFS